MKKTTQTVLILTAVSLTLSLAYAATELARVNSKVITLQAFEKAYKDNAKFFQLKVPTKKNVLNDLINREVGIQEAKKMGLEKDSEVIDRMNTVLFQALIEKKLAPKFNAIQVSDREVESYYKQNPEIRTSHIFVQLRFDANAAQKKAAYDKIKRLQIGLKDALKNGKTFAEYAIANSEGVAAATGGDIDYQTKDKLDPTYYAAAAKMKVGDISDIIQSQFGYHLIKLTAVKDFKDIDVGQFKRILFEEKRNKIFEDYMNDLRTKYKITVHSNLLKEE